MITTQAKQFQDRVLKTYAEPLHVESTLRIKQFPGSSVAAFRIAGARPRIGAASFGSDGQLVRAGFVSPIQTDRPAWGVWRAEAGGHFVVGFTASDGAHRLHLRVGTQGWDDELERGVAIIWVDDGEADLRQARLQWLDPDRNVISTTELLRG